MRTGLFMLGAMLLAPALASADDLRTCRDCPRSEYSRLHYWTPSLYQARSFVRRVNVDQYPTGPMEDVPATVFVTRYRCRAAAPAPTAPYADPESYYGRPLVPTP